MNDKAKQQVVDKIKTSTNILVTVSNDPSVDSLSAALALTLVLNKLGKHATAIFSGATPPAITFLDPAKVFEASTDSLRDFIIALDKEKADHLRYKVEGDSVKIFITPYRTTISSDDLEFSQGDYNVELVIALGVENQGHLDGALEAHGRILHDATVVTISAGSATSSLGSIDWADPQASSLSEIVVTLIESLKPEKEDKPLLDQQTATAILTGIVAETDRFSNPKTSAKVMTVAAQLMAAGADQQLIASKLQESHTIDAPAVAPQAANAASIDTPDGLSIGHSSYAPEEVVSEAQAPVVPSVSETPAPVIAPTTPESAPKSVEELAALQTPSTLSNAYALDPTEESIAAEQAAETPVITPIVTPPVVQAPTDPMTASAPVVDSSTTQEYPSISSHAYMGSAPSISAPINGAAPEPSAPQDIFANNSPAPAAPSSAYAPDEPVAPPDIAPIEQPATPELAPLGETRDDAARDDALAAVHASFDAPASPPAFSPAPGITLPAPPPLPDFSAMSPLGAPAPATQPEILGDILAPEPTLPPQPSAQPATNDPAQFKIPGQ